MRATDYIEQILPQGDRVVKRFEPEQKQFWLDQLYLAQIHIQGIKPKYRNLRLYTDAESENNTKQWIVPTGWHKKYQKYFECNILNRYPTMREERFHWQCSVYPTFAQSLFLQSIDEIRGAIFQEGQYGFVASNEMSDEYLEGNNFNEFDFSDYVTNILVPLIFQDPNGLAVVYPANLVNEFAEPLPVLQYVSSEKIKYLDSELLVFEHIGKDLFVIDNENMFFLTWDNKRQNYATTINILPNFLGVLPFTKLGGYYMSAAGGYYISYFAGAMEWANIAIRQFLDNEAHAKDLIPIVQQVENECNDCNGSGKIPVPCDDDNQIGCTARCTTCKGTGTISRNIGDVLTMSRELLPENGNFPELLKYITPDVAILEHSEKRFDVLLDNVKEALYLKFSQEAQSGVAKAMDREKMYKFLQQFTDNLFDVVENCLAFIDGIITGTYNREAVSVKRPSQFQLKSDADLRKELVELTTANADVMTIQNVSDTLTKIGSENAITEHKLKILNLYDPLRYYTNAQKERFLSVSRSITLFDYVKSLRSNNELDRLIYEKGFMWFLGSDFATVAAELDARLLPYVSELQPLVLMP